MPAADRHRRGRRAILAEHGEKGDPGAATGCEHGGKAEGDPTMVMGHGMGRRAFFLPPPPGGVPDGFRHRGLPLWSRMMVARWGSSMSPTVGRGMRKVRHFLSRDDEAEGHSALTRQCGGGDVRSPVASRGFIQPPRRRIGLENRFDFIADAAEDGELFLLGAGGVGGIVEGEMVPVDEAGINRAGLVGVATDGDDGFDALVEKLVGVFGGVEERSIPISDMTRMARGWT